MMKPQIHIQNLNITLPTPAASPISAILAHAVLSDISKKPDAPVPSRFELACDGEAVIDHKTGIMWQRDDSGCLLSNEAAIEAARVVTIGGFDDWDAPEIDELLSIVDYTRSSPAINTDYFNCEPTYYWTKTPDASSSYYAWIVYFGDGHSDSYHRGNKCRVRACRRVRSPSQ